MKKGLYTTIALISTSALFIGCEEPLKPREQRENPAATERKAPEEAKLTSVTIGRQTWTNRNFNGTTYRNGDPIPECKTDQEWQQAHMAGRGCWCWYDNNPEMDEYYGKIYNFYAMTDQRGLAPRGWHIPTKQEWAELYDFLGGPYDSQVKLRSPNGWFRELNGTNESGFFGVAGGYRKDDGGFDSITLFGMWWSDLDEEGQTWIQNLSYNEGDPSRRYGSRGGGFSVRLVKD
jgi:uncharacterized protein (TIGR02145 family)